ncbi:MAG: hypothetical protein HC795_19035, partial [Coleofasciculaceae cyanobacterium RL_1_1]|nr:hypothetical protein [Coleofasciculaceae cyanobacterium RL_1_1]
MQNDRNPISALLDFLGVTDFMTTLFDPASDDPVPQGSVSGDPSVPIAAADTTPSPTIANDRPDSTVAISQSAPKTTETAAISLSKLLPSETLTVSVESVTVDICLNDPYDPCDRDWRSSELVVLGEGSMSARYDSVYDSLIRNLARRKRQALADELGDLFDAIQDQGYTYADLLGAMREILALQTSGALWEDCLGDLDRVIERALRAQASEPEAFVVKSGDDDLERDHRDRPRLESEKFEREERSPRG